MGGAEIADTLVFRQKTEALGRQLVFSLSASVPEHLSQSLSSSVFRRFPLPFVLRVKLKILALAYKLNK